MHPYDVVKFQLNLVNGLLRGGHKTATEWSLYIAYGAQKLKSYVCEIFIFYKYSAYKDFWKMEGWEASSWTFVPREGEGDASVQSQDYISAWSVFELKAHNIVW